MKKKDIQKRKEKIIMTANNNRWQHANKEKNKN